MKFAERRACELRRRLYKTRKRRGMEKMTHLLLGAKEAGTPRRLPRPLALEIATAYFGEFPFHALG
jgi:hypothetical protein